MKRKPISHPAIALAIALVLSAVIAPARAAAQTLPGYVIITTTAIRDSSATKLEAFRQDRQNHGFDARVILETAWDSAPGATRSERLRTWLQTNQSTLNIEYVLLIGNPDPATGDVPMWPLPHTPNPDNPQTFNPTDFYYAELTAVPGGPIPPANQIELKVGRIPFIVTEARVPDPDGGPNPVTWLDIILRKTIRYNNETPQQGLWRRNAIIPIYPLHAPHTTDKAYLKGEKIKDIVLFPNGIRFHRIYQLDYNLTPPPETTPCSWDIVNNVWQNGTYGLAYWHTHGWAGNADQVMLAEAFPNATYDAFDLNPDYPAFLYQDSCSNADTDFEQNLAYAMLKVGALTTVAATRKIGSRGASLNYFHQLVAGRQTAGEAFFDTQAKDFEVLMNLFGDPSARYWLPLPYSINPRSRYHATPADTGSITVTAEPGYAWTAVSNDSWITVTAGGSGTGNGTITYSVTANPTTARRTGSISIGDYERFMVIQSDFQEAACLPTELPAQNVVDFNNDGRMDFVCAGQDGEGITLYRNDGPDGSGNIIFTPLATNLPAFFAADPAWGDFDNDGLVDVILNGLEKRLNAPDISRTRLFRNTGSGPAGSWEFAEITVPGGLVNLFSGPKTWGDLDNDGDLDLLLSGFEQTGDVRGQIYTKLYRNDGSGGGNVWRFTDMTTGLPAVHSGSAAWVDLDRDGRLDLVLTGTYNHVATFDQDLFKIYRNEGPAGATAWNFTEMRALTNISGCHFAVGDYDHDGDADLFLDISKYMASTRYMLKNEINTGDTTWNFSQLNFGVQGDAQSPPVLVDYDKDGDLDLAIRSRINGALMVRLYRNDVDSLGVFTDQGGIAPLRSNLWADFDNDSDLDLLAGGSVPGVISDAHVVYRNIIPAVNTPPTTPSGLTTMPAPTVGTVSFVWGTAADGQTPTAGLSYNLYVGTTPGGAQIRSPHADTAGGYRRIVTMGDQPGSLTNWTITGLPGGRYWWSVQAIDTSYVGGPFAVEQTFTVNPTISGRVTDAGGNGLSGVSIRGLPGGTVLTDTNGYYAAAVPYDWTGTVTPYLAGGTYFTPGQRQYVRLMTDAKDQNYAVSGTAKLRVQYMTYRTDAVTDTIFVNARVYNDGNNDVSLKDVSFKYWYSSEHDSQAEKVEIDTAFKMPSGAGLMNYTRAQIDTLNPEVNLQDRVQTTWFVSGAGVIKKNEYVEVHVRLHYTDWTKKYTQTGDYSFQNKTVFENTLLIPAYFKGSLVWGNPPF